MNIYKIGITGGIGSGKSFVANILQREFDIPVYNCDQRAKWLMQNNAKLRVELSKVVGESLYSLNGEFVKQEMARYLFASPEHAKQVEQLVHPVVRADFREWCQEQEKGIVALESAILYESGFDSEVDDVLMVVASEETRLRRAMKRDGLTREAILQRIDKQDTQGAEQRARWHIMNEEHTTEEQIKKQIKDIQLC